MVASIDLSPAECHKLRNGGILEPLIHRLHEHSFWVFHQPRENPDIETFLFDFNRKSGKRRQLSHAVRAIIENTAKDARELEVLDLLDAVRAHTDELYSVIRDVKAGESPTLVVSPHRQLADLVELTKESNNCQTMDLLGGVFAILDHFRAVDQFRERFPDAEFFCPSSNVKTVDFVESTLIILKNCIRLSETSDLKVFLGSCRSLIELVIHTMQCYQTQGPGYDTVVVQLCLSFFSELNKIDLKPSGMRAWKVIENIVHAISFSIEDSDPATLYHSLSSLQMILRDDKENVREFLSVSYSLCELICLLVPGEHKFVENSQCHQEVIEITVKTLANMTQLFFKDGVVFGQSGGQLRHSYKSHNISSILVNHLKVAPLDGEFTRNVITMLRRILSCIKTLKKNFQQILDSIEIIKTFKRSNDETVTQEARGILSLFQ